MTSGAQRKPYHRRESSNSRLRQPLLACRYRSSTPTYGCARLIWRKWTGKAVLIVVRPRTKVLRVRALNVLAVAVGSESIPGLRRAIIEDAWVGKIMSDDYIPAVGMEQNQASTKSVHPARPALL